MLADSVPHSLVVATQRMLADMHHQVQVLDDGANDQVIAARRSDDMHQARGR